MITHFQTPSILANQNIGPRSSHPYRVNLAMYNTAPLLVSSLSIVLSTIKNSGVCIPIPLLEYNYNLCLCACITRLVE